MPKNSNKKRGKRPDRPAARPLPWALVSSLEEVEGLLEREQWDAARGRLTELDRRYPNQPTVVELQVNLAYDQQDMQSYQAAAERLLQLTPKNADLTLGLAGAYMSNHRMALALRMFRRFLDRWPNHPRAAEARATADNLEETLRSVFPEYGLVGEDAFVLAAQHEEVMALVGQGQWARARMAAEQVLRRKPDFIPVLNNLSLAYSAEGHVDQAIATSRQVLALDGDNYHALANLVQYCCMGGRVDEARAWAERLKAVASDHTDIWTKKAEAFSLVGDDQSVLEALRWAERDGDLYLSPLLYHLAAVAASRQGREEEARRLWRRALERGPWLGLAQDNLADLDKPAGERHAPWPFTLAQWVSSPTIAAFAQKILPVAERDDPRALVAAEQRFLRQHPELVGLVPLLLDRGDPQGRAFALRVALESKLPELVPALRDFALSQRGPDMMRNQAAEAAQVAGLLPDGPVRLWLQGAWREVEVFGFELYDEPDHKHGPRVEKLQREATQALRKGDAERGERTLKQALELDPDAPDLWNNLAAAYAQQERVQEAEEITRRIFERHPDYLFARTNLALQHIRAGRFDEAEALLKPLRSQRRFHVSEFSALMNARIELATARKDERTARSWYDLWAKTEPDSAAFERWQRVFEPLDAPLLARMAAALADFD